MEVKSFAETLKRYRNQEARHLVPLNSASNFSYNLKWLKNRYSVSLEGLRSFRMTKYLDFISGKKTLYADISERVIYKLLNRREKTIHGLSTLVLIDEQRKHPLDNIQDNAECAHISHLQETMRVVGMSHTKEWLPQLERQDNTLLERLYSLGKIY